MTIFLIWGNLYLYKQTYMGFSLTYRNMNMQYILHKYQVSEKTNIFTGSGGCDASFISSTLFKSSNGEMLAQGAAMPVLLRKLEEAPKVELLHYCQFTLYKPKIII